ncbi:MAG TPA: DedA family protein, partial [Deltaproteobacteria bacterium]|nr:DedA family protein [Deltaproteobacteria bacterium]
MTSFETFLSTYGLIVVVVGTFFEGETVLVLAGLAAHRGYLPLPAVVGAGFVGTILGDQLYFLIGRWRGEAVLARHPDWRPRVARAQAFLERHHVLFILGFRVLYGLRTISPFAVGTSNVRFRRFLALDALTAILWSAGIALLGYSVGKGAETLLGEVRRFELWLFAGLAAA